MKKILLTALTLIILSFIIIVITNKITSQAQTKEFTIGKTTLTVEIADTDSEREQGLSGRKNLPKDQGMLFVLDEPGQYGFWMKDMNFPIDIVWLDSHKKIIGITKNLQPNSYPKIFMSPLGTKYVLELNPGLNLEF